MRAKKTLDDIIIGVLREHGELRYNDLSKEIWKKQEEIFNEEVSDIDKRKFRLTRFSTITIKKCLDDMIAKGIVSKVKKSHKYVIYRLCETSLFELRMREIVQKMEDLIDNPQYLRTLFNKYLQETNMRMIKRLKMYSKIRGKISEKEVIEQFEKDLEGHYLVNELVGLSGKLQDFSHKLRDATIKLYVEGFEKSLYKTLQKSLRIEDK